MAPSSYHSQKGPFEKSNYPLWICAVSFFAPVMAVISGPADGWILALCFIKGTAEGDRQDVASWLLKLIGNEHSGVMILVF